MRHDRTGEPVEDDDPQPDEPFHDPRCDGGWLDRDADVPVPCLVCKPHLAPDLLQRKVFGVDPLNARRNLETS
jgi:hypothetical protein